MDFHAIHGLWNLAMNKLNIFQYGCHEITYIIAIYDHPSFTTIFTWQQGW